MVVLLIDLFPENEKTLGWVAALAYLQRTKLPCMRRNETARENMRMAASLGVSGVEIDGQNVRVDWKDGHVSEFTATYLRVNCSCAECVEEWTNRRLLDPASVQADLRAEDYLRVGRYALQFLWSDAHYTGIYPFEALRMLCQCEQCKAERNG